MILTDKIRSNLFEKILDIFTCFTTGFKICHTISKCKLKGKEKIDWEQREGNVLHVDLRLHRLADLQLDRFYSQRDIVVRGLIQPENQGKFHSIRKEEFRTNLFNRSTEMFDQTKCFHICHIIDQHKCFSRSVISSTNRSKIPLTGCIPKIPTIPFCFNRSFLTRFVD